MVARCLIYCRYAGSWLRQTCPRDALRWAPFGSLYASCAQRAVSIDEANKCDVGEGRRHRRSISAALSRRVGTSVISVSNFPNVPTDTVLLSPPAASCEDWQGERLSWLGWFHLAGKRGTLARNSTVCRGLLRKREVRPYLSGGQHRRSGPDHLRRFP